MSLKGSANVEHEISEVQELIIELQQIIQLRQASLMDAIRKMLAEFMRDGQSESGSSEGSAAVVESLTWAEPTAVGQSPAGAEPTSSGRRFCITDIREILGQLDAEKLQY